MTPRAIPHDQDALMAADTGRLPARRFHFPVDNHLLSKSLQYIRNHQYLFLFLGIFLIYNLNFRNIDSIDTLPASLLPFSILDSHVPWLTVSSPLLQPENAGAFFTVNTTVYSQYPIVTPVLVTPLYVLPYLLLRLLHIPLNMGDGTFFLIVFAMEKLAASFITALAAVVFFAGLKRIVRPGVALLTTLILAFGTSMWSINSQALWQHGMVALLFSILFYLIVQNEEKEQAWTPVAIGVCSALLVFTRPSDMFLALPALVYAIFRNKRDCIVCFVSAVCSALPLIAYNEQAAGNIFGGYSGLLSEFSFSLQTIGAHMAGTLLSPNRGLFVFTPVALLAIPGILVVGMQIKNPALRRVLYSFGLAFILEVLVYSSFNNWWAGTTFGPRFFSGSLPLLFILSGIFLDSLTNRVESKKDLRYHAGTFLRMLLIVLILWSVFVQVVGAFYYPNGNWNDSPATFSVATSLPDADTSRLWNVTDTQIFRTFYAGPIIINPVAVFQNLRRTGDIIDPGTDFAIRIGTSFGEGWGDLETGDGGPARIIANYSSVSIQYMRYSLAENNCTLTLVASALDNPKTLEISVNGVSAGTYTIPLNSAEIVIPIRLKSSLRLGDNRVEFRVADPCSGPAVTGSSVPGCIAVSRIKISRQP